MPRKKVNSSHIDNLDIGAGLDSALSTKPSVPFKFAFEPKVISITGSRNKFSFDEKFIAEFIQDSLKESGGVIYRDNIVLSLKEYGLNDSQINQVFGYGINNSLFSVSNNNRIVKLSSSLKSNPSHSSNNTSEIISFSEYQKSLLVEEKLTYKQRKALSTEVFAWPEKRKYPIHDASHATNAMVRLNTALKNGHVTKTQYNKIKSRILNAYIQFGIKSRKPSSKVVSIKRGKKEVILPIKMAAEHCF